jgi:hypothetical protein
MLGPLDRTANPLVLVAPVRLELWHAREIEVEMGRAARRPSRPREHYAENVLMLVVPDQRAERQELACRLGRIPLGRIAGRSWALSVERFDPPHDVADLRLEREQVVPTGLDLYEQAVEGGDVDPDGVIAALERLDEGRPRPGKGIEHPAARGHVPAEHRLDELRDELPEVGVEPVDVLRPLPLGKVALRPRELEVDLGVERILRRGHEENPSPDTGGVLAWP